MVESKSADTTQSAPQQKVALSARAINERRSTVQLPSKTWHATVKHHLAQDKLSTI